MRSPSITNPPPCYSISIYWGSFCHVNLECHSRCSVIGDNNSACSISVWCAVYRGGKHKNCHFWELKEELKRAEKNLKELKLCLRNIKNKNWKEINPFQFLVFLFSCIMSPTWLFADLQILKSPIGPKKMERYYNRVVVWLVGGNAVYKGNRTVLAHSILFP